ncbi:hypothetical protein BJY52DRAFT_653332 [Lactarius psammicola]|nr:hypothetical protein BJY52DRAFT_653332 [Lactarius psammicola]
MLALSLLLLLLATVGFAAPSRRATSNVPASALADILPKGRSRIVAPTNPPSFVTLAVGFQNFTCTQSGTWAPDGFAAQLLDISGLYPGDRFSTISDDAFTAWLAHPSIDPYDPDFTKEAQDKFGITLIGQHYFKNGPVFDFRSVGPTAGNQDAFVEGEVTGSFTSPDGPPNLDWQEMKAVSGKLAKTIFRVNTRSKELFTEPSCHIGTPDDQAKFTAEFWMYDPQI